ncbi:MAG: DUF2203 domain-containing protein [bacterium]
MQLFTVEQADRTLPLVRRIVEDIVRAHRAWEEALAELDLTVSGTHPDLADPRSVLLEKKIQAMARELDGFQAEVEAIGIQLKDRRTGLVDFPSELDGRPVLLCWRLGESSVQFWHDADSGFAGRQPLAPTLVG